MHTLKLKMAAALALGLGCWAAGADAQQFDAKLFTRSPDALKASGYETFSLDSKSAAMFTGKPDSSAQLSSEFGGAEALKARGTGYETNAVDESLAKAFQ
jgi:hypothetical protein